MHLYGVVAQHLVATYNSTPPLSHLQKPTGVDQVNREENLFLTPTAVQPSVTFTATLDAAAQRTTISLLEVVPLYADEQYILLWSDTQATVLLKEHAGARDYARAMWQAAWLEARGAGSANAEELQASLQAMHTEYVGVWGGWVLRHLDHPKPTRLQI